MAESSLKLPKIRTSMEMSRAAVEALRQSGKKSLTERANGITEYFAAVMPKTRQPLKAPKPEVVDTAEQQRPELAPVVSLALPGANRPSSAKHSAAPHSSDNYGITLPDDHQKEHFKRRSSALITTSHTFLEDKVIEEMTRTKAGPRTIEIVKVLRPVSSDELDESSSEEETQFRPVHLRNQLKLPEIGGKFASFAETSARQESFGKSSKFGSLTPRPTGNYLAATSSILSHTGKRVTSRSPIPQRWFKHLS